MPEGCSRRAAPPGAACGAGGCAATCGCEGWPTLALRLVPAAAAAAAAAAARKPASPRQGWRRRRVRWGWRAGRLRLECVAPAGWLAREEEAAAKAAAARLLRPRAPVAKAATAKVLVFATCGLECSDGGWSLRLAVAHNCSKAATDAEARSSAAAGCACGPGSRRAAAVAAAAVGEKGGAGRGGAAERLPHPFLHSLARSLVPK